MPRPGVNTTFGTTAPQSGVPLDISQAFVAGQTEKGLVGTNYRVTSLASFATQLGARLTTSPVYDAVETALREGANVVNISRIVGPSPTFSSRTLTAASSITIKAKSPGVWGTGLKCFTTGTGPYTITITDSANVVLETSPSFTTNDEAVAWGLTATYVTVQKDGAVIPSVNATAALTGGTDDYTNATAATRQAALAAWPKSLGPGQILFPQEVTPATIAVILAHCKANDRVVLIDSTDVVTIATHTAYAASLRAVAAGNASYGAIFGLFDTVPGLTASTTRRVGHAAAELGVISRSDAIYNAGKAAAGSRTPLKYVIGIDTLSDADIETGILAGVNFPKVVSGVPQTYGFRSLVDPLVEPDWVQFNYARLRMAISSELNETAQSFEFDQIDGAGQKLQEFADALSGVLLEFYKARALYGQKASDSFVVNVGPTVNTSVTIAAGELRAQVAVRMSPHAEIIYIDVAKIPVTQSL